MRIVFVGAVDFSRHCLETILEQNGHVVAVLTLAKERAGFHADYADLSHLAARHNIPVHYIRQIKDPETIALIRSLKPDVIFVFGWSQLVPIDILEIPPKGCIGTHPALLPKNRGRHPIIWALVEGLSESGLTFFYLDRGADSGDILWQKSFPISLEDDASTLYQKVTDLAKQGIQDFLPQLIQGNAPRIPQDPKQATYWRKRTEKDGEIDWNVPTIAIYNLIRALTKPYVGAHTYLQEHKVILWQSKLPNQSSIVEQIQASPGSILDRSDKNLLVKTGDGYINITSWEPFNLQRLSIGHKFGNCQPDKG